MLIDYYQLLGVERLASFEEIKKAAKQRRLELESQQDLGIASELVDSALESVLEAMETLLDGDERRIYDAKLEATPLSEIASTPIKPKFFDFASYRENDLVSWEEYVSWDKNTPPNVSIYEELLEQIVVLPYPEIQSKVLLSALLTPTPLATSLPIVFCWGIPATGKSNIGKFASKIWGNTITPGATPYAALRRKIAAMRETMQSGKKIELPHILVWDDIEERIMRQSPQLFSMLKSGCYRSTSKIEISDKNDNTSTNVQDVFGLRVYSAVYPYFISDFYSELSRRMLIIECKKMEEAADLIDADSVNWNGLLDVSTALWEADGVCDLYRANRRSLVAKMRSRKLLKIDKFTLCKDIISAGITLGLFSSVDNAIDIFVEFFKHNDSLRADRRTVIDRIIEEFVRVASQDKHRNFILPRDLKNELNGAVSSGIADKIPKFDEIRSVMNGLGWELDLEDHVWRKLNDNT